MISVPRELPRIAVLFLVGSIIGWVWNPESWRSVEQEKKPPSPVVQFKSPNISLQELRSLYESGQVVVIDARQRVAYEQGHIPGSLAAWAQGARSLMPEVRRWLPQPADELSVVVVGTTRGYDAIQLAGRLRMTGAVQPRVLDGGINAWKDAGLPLVEGWDMEPLLEKAE